MMSKRIRGHKYIVCACHKHQEIHVGMIVYKYLNILLLLTAVPLIVLFMLVPSLLSVSFALFFIAVITLVPLSIYRSTSKMMQKSGHTEECSKRVALLEVVYHGAYSQFELLENKDVK